MSGSSKAVMRIVMRTIFGTDAALAQEEERATSIALIAEVERKMDRLDQQIDKKLSERPPRNLDEALNQVSGSER